MTAELTAKRNASYDEGLEQEAVSWIRSYVPDFAEVKGQKDVHLALKDGVALCKLINALAPGSVRKINESKMAFKQMENISLFLAAIEKYGVLASDTFQTVDLYENTNMTAVISGIHALGRKVESNTAGGGLGVKESSKNERTFTEAQMKEGQSIIGLQMGTNKGATQAGQNFGKTRAIIDWFSFTSSLKVDSIPKKTITLDYNIKVVVVYLRNWADLKHYFGCQRTNLGNFQLWLVKRHA